MKNLVIHVAGVLLAVGNLKKLIDLGKTATIDQTDDGFTAPRKLPGSDGIVMSEHEECGSDAMVFFCPRGPDSEAWKAGRSPVSAGRNSELVTFRPLLKVFTRSSASRMT
jgi:hypothetical protein